MKNFFVSAHIAKTLFNKGYDELCLGYYTTNDDDGDGIDVHITETPTRNSDLVNGAFSTPTYHQVLDFLRDKHNIHIQIEWAWEGKEMNTKYFTRLIFTKTHTNRKIFEYREDYYKALLEGIKEALELI